MITMGASMIDLIGPYHGPMPAISGGCPGLLESRQ